MPVDTNPDVRKGLAHCLARITGKDEGDELVRELAGALTGDEPGADKAPKLCRELKGCSEASLCLVGFDLPGIQRRIFDTSKRPVIRATSEMIRRACRDVAGALEKQTGLPESCVIFSGGGQGVVLAPAKDAKQVKAIIAGAFEDHGLENLTCEHLVFEPMELIERDSSITDKQARALGVEDMQPVALLRQRLGAKLEAGRSLALRKRVPGGGERCAWCRTRQAGPDRAGARSEKVCPDCARRYKRARELKKDEAEDFESIVKDFAPRAPRIQSLAILYADGNNIGGVLEKLATLRQFQAFSRALDDAVQQGVEAVERRYSGLQEGKHLIKLLVGGDDALVLLPGSIALDFACDLCEHVERVFTPGEDAAMPGLWRAFPRGSPAREAVERVGLSVGVVFAAPSFPIRMMLRYARECLKAAKERAHREQGSSGDRSYLDFACVDKGTHVGTALVEDRKRRLRTKLDGRTSLLTERPHSLAEARLLLDEVRLLQGMPASQVYDLRKLLLDTPEAGRLQVEYQLARSTAWLGFCRQLSGRHEEAGTGYLTDSPVRGVGLATWRRRGENAEMATPVLDWLELRGRVSMAREGGR